MDDNKEIKSNALEAKEEPKTEEIFIPVVDNGKKSSKIRLSLNGKALYLERGKSHAVPKAYAKLWHQKQAFRDQAAAFSKKNLAENAVKK